MEVGVFLNFTVIKFRCEINDVFSLSLSLSLSLGGSRECAAALETTTSVVIFQNSV